MRDSTRTAICIILAMTTVLWSSGCALLFKGTTQDVLIHCNVPDAQISVDGQPVNPGITSLDCRSDHVVTAEKPGYPSVIQRIRRRAAATFVVLDAVLLAFWIIPGAIALAVDFGSGAIHELTPETVNLELRAIGDARSGQERQNFCIFCGESLGRRTSDCGACGRSQ